MKLTRSLLGLAFIVLVLAACKTDPIGPEPDPRLFEDAIYISVGTNVHGIAVADLEGDGHLDLVATAAGSGTIEVLRGAGGRVFVAPLTLHTGINPKHAVVVDINSDGRLDIAVANQNAEGDDVNVYLQFASGAFASPIDLPACSNPHQIGAGDLNGDGYIDIVVACWGENDFAVIPGAPEADGYFGDMFLVPSGGERPHAVIVADLDQDGLDDVVLALHDSNAVGVLMSDGALGFSEPALYSGGAQQHSLAVADLNGDGYPDLVSANRASHNVTVLRNRGSLEPGVFDTQLVSVGANRFPVDVAVGDLDGDGHLDIVTANSFGNYPPPGQDPVPTDVSVVYGVAGSFLSIPEFFAVDATPFAVAVADLDADGLLDVVTANWHSSDVGILFGAGGEREPGAGP